MNMGHGEADKDDYVAISFGEHLLIGCISMHACRYTAVRRIYCSTIYNRQVVARYVHGTMHALSEGGFFSQGHLLCCCGRCARILM